MEVSVNCFYYQVLISWYVYVITLWIPKSSLEVNSHDNRWEIDQFLVIRKRLGTFLTKIIFMLSALCSLDYWGFS